MKGRNARNGPGWEICRPLPRGGLIFAATFGIAEESTK